MTLPQKAKEKQEGSKQESDLISEQNPLW